MRVYLDIETIPGQSPELKHEIERSIAPPANYKKADTIEKWEAEQKPALVEEAWRRTAFDGDRGEIVCIAWAVDDGEVQCAYRRLNDDESLLLYAFFEDIKTEVDNRHGIIPTWVGHNVRDFDLRFLFQRAVILNVRPPIRLPHDARPNGEFVFDTMTAWAGYRNRISLNRLCKALGIPQKGEELNGADIDGSKVWDYVLAGRAEEVSLYCKGDVERTRSVYKKLVFKEDPVCLP